MANCPHTIGVEFGTRIIEVASQKIKLQIWDTGKQLLLADLHWHMPPKRLKVIDGHYRLLFFLTCFVCVYCVASMCVEHSLNQLDKSVFVR